MLNEFQDVKKMIDSQYIEILFKALGLCIISQITVDIIRDCKENALADMVELTTKISLLILALPLFSKLLEIINGLL
jgi:stage III sporulation protein AD